MPTRSVGLAVLMVLLALAAVSPAVAQTGVEVSTSADPKGGIEIFAPAPGARDATRPREADFYREDIRVRHEPGYIKPLTATPKSGPIKKIGLSGWTAPPGRGDGSIQHENNGWFGFGLSLTWE
jgi:hypothetical protein